MENPLICMNTCFMPSLQRDPFGFRGIFSFNQFTTEVFLTSSLEIFRCPFPKYAPVCTLGQQYDLALTDPRYFYIILELSSYNIPRKGTECASDVCRSYLSRRYIEGYSGKKTASGVHRTC
ncbi:hypothetical protein V6N13_020315 [Hibiscus sabdariffa]